MTESIFWHDHEKDMTNPEYARAYYEAQEEIRKMKKTPAEWQEETGITVMDPDGWDRGNFEEDWFRPLTRDEFEYKAARSTSTYSKGHP